MIHRTCLAVIVVLVASAAPAHAYIILDIGSSTIPADQTAGSVDVTIHSTSSSGDSLNSFANMTFQIVPSGPVSSPLRFISDTPDQYEFNDPNYVFAGQSLSLLTGPSAVFQPLLTGTEYANDTVQGADSAFDGISFPDVPISTTPLLLGRLQFAFDQAPASAETFNIRYLSGDFATSDAAPVYLAGSAVPDGTVTFLAGTGVPEPSTAVLVGLGVVLLAAGGLVRRVRRAL